jgi:hypothetical protein
MTYVILKIERQKGAPVFLCALLRRLPHCIALFWCSDLQRLVIVGDAKLKTPVSAGENLTGAHRRSASVEDAPWFGRFVRSGDVRPV